VLSHQVIHAKFSRIMLSRDIEIQGMTAIKKSDLKHYPFPRLIALYIQAESPDHTDL